MAQYNIKGPLTDDSLNKINHMFDELYKKYTGAGLDAAEAREKAIQAVTDAEIAKETAEVTREEMLAIIREQTQNGDLAPEIAQARQGKETLGENLNSIKSDLAQTDNQVTDTSVRMGSRIKSTGVSASKKPVPTIVIFDDDTRTQLYSVLYPYMLEKGLPFTSALISSRIGNPDAPVPTISYEQFIEMRDSGIVDFVNHTHNHVNLTVLSEEEIEYEVRTCQEYLNRHGIYTRHLAYPFGRYNSKVRVAASKFVDSATIGRNDAPKETWVVDPNRSILDNFYVPRIVFETDIEEIEERIDYISKNNGLLIINTHAQYSTFSIEKLERIVNNAHSKGVVFKSFSDAYEDFSNILELRSDGTTKVGISATGFDVGIKDFEISEIKRSAEQRPRDYPSKISAMTFSNSEAQEYGWPFGGTVITHIISGNGENSFTFQLLIPAGVRYLVLKRNWNATGQRWSDFDEVGGGEKWTQLIGINASSVPFVVRDVPASNRELRNRNIIAQPDFDLPDGIFYNVRVKNENTVELKLSNIVGESIPEITGNWTFKAF